VGLVSAALDRVPHLVHVTGPHPYWGGRPQALHVAIERKDREMFEMLLARGADPSGRTDEYDGWSPLMLAANREQPEMMRALVKYGAHVGLYEALMMGDDRQLRRLLAAGAPALAGSVPNNGSPLMFARTPFAIRRLVELGAPLDRADRWGATPIQALSALGKSGAALVTLMASLGAEASPAVRARIGDLDYLRRLATTDVDAVISDAVLAAAVENGNADMVRWLLDSGANANARVGGDADRRSVLHNAAWNGAVEIVRALVERGADVTVRDAEHHSTPLDWARTAIEVTRNAACAEVARLLEPQAP
jgi:ankyrin repeat protein